MSNTVPILDCEGGSSFHFRPSAPPLHPLDSPQLDVSSIPNDTLDHLRMAASHLHAERLVAIPTETVYGLGASAISPKACARVYKLKGRPSDNPLIVHVSSLDMLSRLTPMDYTPSKLYLRLMETFWPGPLTILFPHKNPPPRPAPQTVAVRFPAHPVARALIQISDLPVAAPSANSSGRPSPTEAQHVFADLGIKGALSDQGDEPNGPGVLGCILSAGSCSIGLESTVIDATGWSQASGGGVLKVLRPGGVGVEELEQVLQSVDREQGTSSRVWVWGRDKPLTESDSRHATNHSQASTSSSSTKRDLPFTPVPSPPATPSARSSCSPPPVSTRQEQIMNPSTPGMKYKHYSPSVPVYLVYPDSTFDLVADSSSHQGVVFVEKGSRVASPASTTVSKGQQVGQVMKVIADSIQRRKQAGTGSKMTFGLMAFDGGKLSQAVSTALNGELQDAAWHVQHHSLGKTPEDAARSLFGGMLKLEGRPNLDQRDETKSVDAILIEATPTKGIGLAFMERAGKAVGGGGALDLASVCDDKQVKRFLVRA